jgi:hypothetical protein
MGDYWITTYDETGAERTSYFSGYNEEDAIDQARWKLTLNPKGQLENYGHLIAAVTVYNNTTESEVYVAALPESVFPAFSDFVMR